MHLSVMSIEAASKKIDKQYVSLKDDNTPGLFLRLYKNGTKMWMVRKTVNGKELYQTLGNYPEIRITEARKKAKSLIKAFVQENDVIFDSYSKSSTFGEIFNEWMNFKKTKVKDWKRQTGVFKLHILPFLSDIKYSDIQPVMVRNILLKLIETEGKYETANRLCIWIGQMERYALALGFADHLRFQGLSSLLPSAKRKHLPSFPPSEIDIYMPKIVTACTDSMLVWDTLRLAFYTLLRPSEYTSIEWSWIKDDYIEIPAEVMKMKKPHRVPITTQIMDLLNNRPCKSQFVLPSPRLNKPISIIALEKTFVRHGLKGILVPHGIRSIGRTWMVEKSVDTAVAEACLAHSFGTAVQQAYNRSDLLELRRGVMQEWCDFVSESIRRATLQNQAAPIE